MTRRYESKCRQNQDRFVILGQVRQMPDDGAGGLKHGPAPMQTAPASVRNWLLVVAAMIFFMIVLGALTRLTESGLSMVEWRPVTGWEATDDELDYYWEQMP